MKQGVATALGFLAASMFPPAVLSMFTPLSGELSLGSAAGTFVVTYPFSAAFTFLFGIPTFLLLRRFRPGKWWIAVIVGFLLGIPVAAAVRSGSLNPRDMLVFGPLAAGAALVFWLIWSRGDSSHHKHDQAPTASQLD